MIRLAKGAAGRLLFLLALCAAGPAVPAAQDCAPTPTPEVYAVKRVVDGDTLQLRDGRQVRLLGINTPELGRRDTAAQPFAAAARDALRAHVADTGGRIRLAAGVKPRDRYGRTLAYVYTPEGADLGAALLVRGLAYYVILPPNDAHAACYRRLEQQARAAGLGLWQPAHDMPLPAADITSNRGGFVLTRGTVTAVNEPAGHLVIQLDGNLELFIHRRHRAAFALDAARLEGRVLEARGWLYEYRNRPNLRLAHPGLLAFAP